jgi:nicotinate-nucleotide adenylyltransferase
MEMARLATAGDPLFEVSDVEITREPPSYTIETVEALQRQGVKQPGLLIGADSIDELSKWHRVKELLQAVRLVIVPRPPRNPQDVRQRLATMAEQLPATQDSAVIAGPMVEISATNIRKRIQNHRPIRYFLPEAVAEFIKSNELYMKPK